MRHLFCLVLLAGLVPAEAATVLGSPRCIDYHSAYVAPERKIELASYQSWLLGYLSGLSKGSELVAQELGKERFPGEYNVLNDAEPDALFRQADDWCRQNPDRKLLDAGLRLFEKRLNEQVDELSDPVTESR